MSRARTLAVPAVVALAGALLLGWLRLLTPALSDYEEEAEASIIALRAGDLAGFFEHAPAYGGSLALRAPFALLPNLWGGGDLAAYRTLAAPCLVAGAVLGVWLWTLAAERGHARSTGWIALLLCVTNPLTLWALEFGHPEELFGGALCVAAVLAALARRPVLAGVLLGVAVANKPWAALAGLPVLLALDSTRARVQAAAVSSGLAAAVLAPFLLTASGAVAETVAVATSKSVITKPWQIWWFFGETTGRDPVTGLASPGHRMPADWAASIGRLVVLAVPLAMSLVAALAWGRRPRHDALALLALAFLVRCLIDPWNHIYYELPFILALLAWELHAWRRPPVLALAATLLCWLTIREGPPDVLAAAFLAWSLPLAGYLAVVVLRPGRLRAGMRSPVPAGARA